MLTDFSVYLQPLREMNPIGLRGRVTRVVGLIIEGEGPGLPVGGLCRIQVDGYETTD